MVEDKLAFALRCKWKLGITIAVIRTGNKDNVDSGRKEERLASRKNR